MRSGLNTHKNDAAMDAILQISSYIEKSTSVSDLSELMACEGLASKVYFKNHFNNVQWLKQFNQTDSVYIFKLSNTCRVEKYGFAKNEDFDLLIVE